MTPDRISKDYTNGLVDEGIEIALFGQTRYLFYVEHCQWDNEHPTFSNHRQLKAFEPDFPDHYWRRWNYPWTQFTLVRNNRIPILGINTGRLGFLSNVAKEEIGPAIDKLLAGNYVINPRYTLMVTTDVEEQPDPNFALNEVTVSRKGTTSMITVHTYINDEYLNSYWADGLIVATTTGSTGYSLSCGWTDHDARIQEFCDYPYRSA